MLDRSIMRGTCYMQTNYRINSKGKAMYFTIVILALFASFTAEAGFINPMDFDGSEQQKNEVIQYIKDRVRKDYCSSSLDMCQNTILRMMEKENLSAFKRATKATNRSIMDRVIKDYCSDSLDLCNYTTIEMMYKQNYEAGNERLKW